MTLEALRARAFALHGAGRFAEAERAYAQVLRDTPADVAVLSSSAAALRELGRPAEALARASAAVALQPTLEGLCQQGVALRDLGRFDEALVSFDRALAIQPRSFEVLNYRGLTLVQLRRFDAALASLDAALTLRPDSAELRSNRGNLLRRLGRLPEALASYDQAIALRPDFAVAHSNRGLALHALQRYRDAAASYQRALELQPDSADIYANLGGVQYELGELEASLASGRRALELRPGMHGVHGNLGNALRDLARPQEALSHYELALQETPDAATCHCHRGNALHDLGRICEALASYERAIALDPRHAQAHFNKSLCLLLSGDFVQGLPLYEWRQELPRAAVSPPGVGWRGEVPLPGKRLYVYADQALGDTIQFCRYARLAQEQGARVVLAVQPQLRELLSTLSATVHVVDRDAPAEPCDYHTPLMSLPLAFRTNAQNIPAAVPYLSADPLRVERWRAWLGQKDLRVGIVWQGSRNRIDVGRSVPLSLFERLADVAGVRLISLQKGPALEELRAAGARFPVEIPAEPFDEGPQALLDSAALVAVLDLVIGCDTAVAHLAGALARPTWVALKYVPDWRWQLDRADTPWYPSLRLFRQPRLGDWASVFAVLRDELARLARERAGGAASAGQAESSRP